MSAGNRISFEIPIPNPEAQQEQFLTFDLDDDFRRVVIDNVYLELELTKRHLFDGSDLDSTFANLPRIFVYFTQEQKAAIRALAAAGDVAGVRSALWDEIEREYGKPRPESMR